MATITFTDFYGTKRTGEIEKSGFIGEQKWLAVSVDGVNWLVPQGKKHGKRLRWPNNATAICEEEYPAEYAQVMEQI